MSLFFYNFFLAGYVVVLRIAAFFHPKARKWVKGRRGWRERLSVALQSTAGKKRIWIHCASLGEFEQGRPLIEAVKKHCPENVIVLTFFSPSGYEVRKDYTGADHIFYLPADGKKNARAFIDIVAPDQAIFVKYEYWYHYIHTLQRRSIPVMLISAAFRPGQIFFRWYGGFFRRLLQKFSHIFVQDETSARLLADAGITQEITVAGDTRYDRVTEIAAQAKSFPLLEIFRGDCKLVIAGSTWPEDEKILHSAWQAFPDSWKLVLAPHEVDAGHIRELQRRFGDDVVLYSALQAGTGDAGKRILLIDNIGMLSALYRYGEIAYVGGGFQKGGIHNILEPAVFGLPVLFGPNYRKFVEAREMAERNYAIPVQSTPECKQAFQRLISNTAQLQRMQAGIREHVQQQRGATERILGSVMITPVGVNNHSPKHE